jgi:hypothetical protein
MAMLQTLITRKGVACYTQVDYSTNGLKYIGGTILCKIGEFSLF